MGIEYFRVQLGRKEFAYGQLLKRTESRIYLRRVHLNGSPFDQPSMIVCMIEDCQPMRMNRKYCELEPMKGYDNVGQRKKPKSQRAIDADEFDRLSVGFFNKTI